MAIVTPPEPVDLDPLDNFLNSDRAPDDCMGLSDLDGFLTMSQKLKQIGESGIEGESAQKASILGALSLYLDFINMFLFLLRIFGNSR